MEKSYQIDYDEWEFLPDTEFLDYHENGKKGRRKKELFSRQSSVFDPKTTSSGMNYFIIQSPTTPHIVRTPVNVQLEPNLIKKKHQDEVVVEQQLHKVLPQVTTLEEKKDDQDTISRVFFKKTEEFVDMKMDSPRSTNREVKVQSTESGPVQFEEKDHDEIIVEPEIVVSKKCSSTKKEAIWKGSVNIMGWKITGVEALCCVGIAAATTICIFIFGRTRKPKQLQFQIENKKIKQIVQQEPTSNGAKSEARGTNPLIGAHLIFGSH